MAPRRGLLFLVCGNEERGERSVEQEGGGAAASLHMRCGTHRRHCGSDEAQAGSGRQASCEAWQTGILTVVYGARMLRCVCLETRLGGGARARLLLSVSRHFHVALLPPWIGCPTSATWHATACWR